MARFERPGKWGFLLGGGERHALDGLFRRHGDAVYRLAAGLLRDRDEASDVTQEVFLQAARNLGELRDLPALWPWLKAVTLNLCRDRARQRSRLPDAAAGPDSDGVEELGDGSCWPAETDLMAMVIRDCVERLSPREREVIVAHYQHGMTYREVAGHLGCSVATVQWWMDRGMQHLAEMVTKESGVEAREERRGA